jgi:hypothetical protein
MISAAMFGFIGFAIFKIFSFMYGVIICFNNSVVRIEAPIIGLIIGVTVGIIAAVIADYKDRLLMAQQKNNGQESPEFQIDSFTGTLVPTYRTAYEMHCDEQYLFSDNENTQVCNQQHSL